MSDQQIELSQVKAIFDAYIKEFNTPLYPDIYQNKTQPTSAISQLLKDNQQKIAQQLKINYFQVNHHTMAMVGIKDLTHAFQAVIKQINEHKIYRISKILNLILGDVYALTAHHVICIGFDGAKYWMVKKEPCHDINGPQYSYHLSSIEKDNPQISQDPNYLMTEDNLKEALIDESLAEEFYSEKQQKTILTSSIMNLDEFNQWTF